MTDATAAPDAPEATMPGEGTPTQEIVRVTPAAQAGAIALITDDEIRRLWRLSSALAASNLFKDTGQAAQAFAKMVVGRDLGLSPYQAMTLHVIEGKVEVPAVMMGNFVRSREGYDFEVFWLKADADGAREVVAAVDEDPADPRADVGCAIRFTVGGEPRGVSRFTVEDAVTADLTRDTRSGKKSNHVKFPRNMCFARAMSNGCKWLVPEVLAGLPVYHEGELPRQPDSIAAGEGSGEAPGVDLGPDVEAVLARAAELGHAALADRATAEMVLGDQPPGTWVEWCRDATATLDALEASMTEADVVEPDATPGGDGDPGADVQNLHDPSGTPDGVAADAMAEAFHGPDAQVDDALERLLRQREALRDRLEDEAPEGDVLAEARAELEQLDEAVAGLCPHLTFSPGDDGAMECARCGLPLDAAGQDELPL